MSLVDLNGVSLFYRDTGAGLPCVVVHGGLGLDHVYMTPLDALGDSMRLIYVDLRGNGRSVEQSIETLTFENLCADLDALRAHLGFERWAVLGHSYGGFIAQEYALRYPERVTHLFLVGTAPSFGDYDDEIAANIAERNPSSEVLEAVASEPANDENFARMMAVILPLYFHNYDHEVATREFEGTIFRAAAANRGSEISRSYNVTSRLGDIAAPTLVLVGRDDFICPVSRAEIMRAGIPDAELVIFERSGHMPFIEESEAFGAAVRDWLARHPRSEAPASGRRPALLTSLGSIFRRRGSTRGANGTD